MSNLALHEMSVAELTVLHKKTQILIDSKQDAAVAKVYSDIKALAESVGMTVEQIANWGKTKTDKRKVEPRYRDHDDYDKTWTGRGMQPKWIKERISQGFKLEDFIIHASEEA